MGKQECVKTNEQFQQIFYHTPNMERKSSVFDEGLLSKKLQSGEIVRKLESGK
jgi:hypothetical protein